MSKPSDEQVLQQTEAIWRMLDTMSLSNPKEYEQFIQKVLKDGENDNMGPPQPVFVVETVKVPEVIPVRKYFINFTKWIQLPQPENETSPIAMATSDVRKEIVDKEWSYIIDVTLNPVVFPSNDSTSQIEKCALVELVFRHIETKLSLKLSRKFQFAEESSYVGNKDNLLNFICPSALKNKLSDSVNGANNNLTLEQIKRLANNNQPTASTSGKEKNEILASQRGHSSMLNNNKIPSIMTSCKDDTNSLKEIKTSSSNKTNKTLLPAPKVEMLVCKDKNTIELTVYLPNVESVSECDLEIMETCLSLYVPKKYELELPFPVNIDIDHSSAKFVKDQRILMVTARTTELYYTIN